MADFLLKEINTKKYLIGKVYEYSFLIIFILTAFLLGNGRTRSILDMMSFPIKVQLLVFIISSVSFIIWLSILFSPNKKYNLGKILFFDNRIVVSRNNAEFPYEKIQSVELLLNPSENKNIFKRKMNDDGSNNWLTIKNEYSKQTYELFIPSKNDEEILINLFEGLKSKNITFTLGKSSKSLLNRLAW